MQVPLPPRSPLVQVLEFNPGGVQLPTTVAPLSGLCAASCTSISTIADQLVPSLLRIAVRLPTCIAVLCGFTDTTVDAWLFAAFSSVTLCCPVSVCAPMLPPVVFQA